MASIAFSHIGIACQDPENIERFYTKYFGFQRARHIPLGDDAIVFIKSGDVYLEIFKAKEESSGPANTDDGPWTPGWRHIAFQVDSVDAKLAELGDDARTTLGPMGFDDFIHGWRSVWIADPEGNIIEISEGYVDQENPPAL